MRLWQREEAEPGEKTGRRDKSRDKEKDIVRTQALGSEQTRLLMNSSRSISNLSALALIQRLVSTTGYSGTIKTRDYMRISQMRID